MQGRTVGVGDSFDSFSLFSLVEIRYNSMFLATNSSNLVGRNHIPVPWGPAFRDGSRCSHAQPRWSVATWPGHCPRKSSSGRKMAHVPRMMEVEGTWYTSASNGFQWFSATKVVVPSIFKQQIWGFEAMIFIRFLSNKKMHVKKHGLHGGWCKEQPTWEAHATNMSVRSYKEQQIHKTSHKLGYSKIPQI